MSLQLLFHPLASYCHKVLIALYENGTAFEGRIIHLQDPAQRAELLALWPIGKFPVLCDSARKQTLPESSIIIEYLDRHYPGPQSLIPREPDVALKVRLWDRFFDAYVHEPMQRIVADTFRAAGRHDPDGVAAARTTLETAYGMLDRALAAGGWAGDADFSLADCAAAPSLFYAGVLVPFAERHAHLAAYFDRLCGRASVVRTLKEAQPYFAQFPMYAEIPARFLAPDARSFARECARIQGWSR